MTCFEVKMTGYEKQYTFTHNHIHLLQESNNHPNPPKLEGKLQIARLLDPNMAGLFEGSFS